MYKKFILLLLITLTFSLSSLELNLWSTSAIAIDFDTEQVIYQKNKDLTIQPASMAKLITLYMVYDAIDKGIVDKNDIVTISSTADYKNLPPDSSLMFIEKGQKVTLFELMTGLAIPSGNDAAIAIAEFLFGSVENYLKEVNSMVKNLGLVDLTFADSSGYSDKNKINVAQFAEFCIIFLKKFPESLEELFSVRSFTYPKKKNGLSSIGPITQYNHNPIIKIFPECDGLKTGFINSSGMNISLTAKRGKRRVIAVLVGIKDDKKNDAELKRVYDSVTLLNYALDNYENIPLDKIKLPGIKVLNSKIGEIFPIIPYKRYFSVNKFNTYTYTIDSIESPIEYGQLLGYVLFTQSSIEYKFPIYSNKQIYLFN